jgi:hypothetical protein
MKPTYPLLALGLGLLLALLLQRFGAFSPTGDQRLPLLTLLLMSELGFIATAIAAVISVRDLMRFGPRLRFVALLTGNLLLAGALLWTGITLWRGSIGS